MNGDEYRSLVAELVAQYPPETAARLIEARCRGPYRRPPRSVLFPPASSGAPGGNGSVAVTGSAQTATGPQDGAA